MIFDYLQYRYNKHLHRLLFISTIGCTLFLISALFLSFAYKPAFKAFRLQGYAQGTSWHIVYYSEDSVISQRSVDSLLTAVDSSLSLYKPYSTINKFNASAQGILMDAPMKKVVEKSIEIFTETKGIFDVTVQPLVEAWGFGANKVENLPDSARIKELLKCVGTGKLTIKKDSLYKKVSCLHLDLNGIAQGYSVDVLADFFRQKKIDNFLIELGGELVISGRKPGGEMMNVAIEAPGSESYGLSAFQKILHLDHGSLTTSGNYRKFYESNSRKINHLIDPFTGYSFQNDLISVTVWAKDAMTADGYDNALMGMGLKKALGFMETKKDMEAYFIFRQTDGSIKDTSTRGFRLLFHKR